MDKEEPTPYAWAPTRSGRRLAKSIDQTMQEVDSASETDTGTPASRTPNPTPDRPSRAMYRIPSDSDDDEEHGAIGNLFRRRGEYDSRERREVAVQPVTAAQAACTCGRCEQMPTDRENRCCQLEPLSNTHLDDYAPGKCLLQCKAIQHILSRISVQCSWLRNMRYYGLSGDDLRFANMNNTNYRHHAYRNYIDFIYGTLGRHNRRVVPACIVSYVRRTWPDPHGSYVGFVEVNEDGQEIFIDEVDSI